MGAVPDQRPQGHRPDRDVGARAQREQYDGVRGVVGGEAGEGGGVTAPPLVLTVPHVHLRMDWSDEGRRRTGAGKCRVGACQIARETLAADLLAAQNELRAERDTVGAKVAGQVRVAEEQVATAQREMESCKRREKLPSEPSDLGQLEADC
eukprot:430602-Prymnesium_polylepis.2